MIRDQPWTGGRRRRRLALYLQALLEAPGEELQLEGAHGLWELGINKEHHADISADTLAALVTGLSSPSVQVRSWHGVRMTATCSASTPPRMHQP
jgi:hypothetical protein